MSYTDLRDFEAEFEMFADSGLFVQVEKLGGGAVGRAYTGTWRYVVSNGKGQEIARAQDLETRMPKTHAEAAALVADYYEPSSDDGYGPYAVGAPRVGE